MTRPAGGPGRWATVALIAGGAAWGVWVVGTAFDEPFELSAPQLAADLTVGLLMQWVGIIAWRRSGTGRTGPLLYAAGLLWYVGSIWDLPPLGSITFAFRGWYDPLLMVVVLGWATGHLRTGFDRLVIGTIVVAYAVRSAVRLLAFDGAAVNGPEWRNPFLLSWDEGRWIAIEAAVIQVSVVVAIAFVVACTRRWIRATGPARRTLTPVLVAGAMMVPLIGWTAFTNQFIDLFQLPTLPDGLLFWSQIVLRAMIPIAILVAVFRLGSGDTLARLLQALDRGVPVGSLEATIAEALGDPALRLVFGPPEGPWLDGQGRVVDLPTLSAGRSVATIVDTTGDQLALIVHDPALDENPDLVPAAGAAARLALTNERLQAEVRAQLEAVRASRARLVEASDGERRRVERDLHDGAQQRLVVLALRLRQARDLAADHGDVTALLDDAGAELELALGELRELARGIHPATLTRAGLAPAIEALALRCPLPVAVHATPDRCPPMVESTAYFVVAEALTNVVRYAGATGIEVGTERRNGTLVVTVVDDGTGGADPDRGSGLRGLDDRVTAIGGRLAVVSPAGGGTRVEATLPCGS